MSRQREIVWFFISYQKKNMKNQSSLQTIAAYKPEEIDMWQGYGLWKN
jgi:hypothetical protein